MNAAMHKKIRAYYDEVLGKGVEPDADQVWNGDEVGFDPNGKWGKVLCFKGVRLAHPPHGLCPIFIFVRARPIYACA